MERKVSPDDSERREVLHRLHGDDDRGLIERTCQHISDTWNGMHDFIITPLGPRAYALRIKSLIADESPKLETLKEHNNLILCRVLGVCLGKNDRHVGYVILFSGAPIIHHNTRYTSFSYSEPTELRTREMRVIYDDPYVRLARFGVHVFDYLWACRKRVDAQVQVDVADHASATIFAGAWRDGM